MEISARYSASIRLAQEIIPEIVKGQSMDFSYNYNCFAFALDLHKDEHVKELMIAAKDKASQDIYVSPQFVRHLLDEARDFSIDIDQMVNEDSYYTIYFHKERPKHAGKFRLGRVVSKWGAGHVWEHGIFELPESYGDEVRFYREMPRKKLIDAFFAWAKSKAQGL